MIETKRLKITQFKAEYAPEFTHALSDPRIFMYLPESVPTIEDIEKLIGWFIQRDVDNLNFGFSGTNFALILKKSKNIIGWCGIQPFEPIPDKMEIFYGLSPKFWNRGYITEAVQAILNYGFESIGLDEIVAGVKPENIASINVLEKIGFRYQHTISQVPEGSEFYLGERYYSITKESFEKKNSYTKAAQPDN